MSTAVVTRRARAQEIALEVGDRLRSVRDRGPGLLDGHPGLAVLHAALSAWDPARAAVAHAHLAASGEVAPEAVVPAVLVHRAVHRGGYDGLLRKAGAALAEVCESWPQRDRPAAADYDVITGLAGKGRLLLALGGDRCLTALEAVLARLVALTRPVLVDGHEVPGWWCAPERYAVDADRERYPRGDFDAGLAHGISGPLALLSLAHRHGLRVAGMTDAMRVVVDWLLRWSWTDESGVGWPSRVGFDAQVRVSAVPASRSAWCYGTAGVAHALHLAATELGDAGATGLAVAAMRRPGPAEGPTVCHGDAGLLQVSVRMGVPADRIADRVLAAFDPSAPFGFRHRLHTGGWADEPGLLQGAAGVALALASYAGNPAPWDVALLLA
ncbi:lanthionine synthetase C family protein [Amycolatopsis sp. NPDC006125]|uniref:lanthionine synthetase C family protein n=1 Tax=Amycolatopsis sp. NPDC006125 TaxID=3156730 RepID=UPI0033BF4C05